MGNRLEGKVTVITGGTSGIGEATVRRFVAEGARVMIAGRTVEKGEALAAELGEAAAFRRTDVTGEADIAALIDATVETFGRLDVLFNNAGAPDRSTPEEVDEAGFDRAMRLLVGSVVFGVKHAARVMKPQGGGAIINNASIAGWRYGQGSYLYSGAKAAVSHLTRMAGVDLGPHGIRVNAISPGAVATPIFWGGSERAQSLSDEENAQKMAKLTGNLAHATPTPRAGEADDIADAAVFLASEESGFVNCHDLVVDGGRIWMFNEKSG
ncbi:short-chain dehydrogenase [Salinisphaera sp. PC39]|uniref:SDR family NAD(P)-dependent oxidoreductase n=1 Tax=Salinisphaera sp. PC39 TaxID=1304156 RepID=UPI00333FFA4A